MKKFLIFAFLFVIVTSFAQANTNDTIVAGNRVSIAKGDTAFIAGIDSIIIVKSDTITNSEKIDIYADGKKKMSQWVQSGYTSNVDPNDSLKVVIQVVGGDVDSPDSLPIAFIYRLLVCIVILIGFSLVKRLL
ncbi:MAG: hypothetical protein WC010_03610 [Candidatus Absconditabacterales bacterium]